jgi:hypothetical protein
MPSKQYMLNRALNELQAVIDNKGMGEGEIHHCIGIAIKEIRDVIHLLDTDDKQRLKKRRTEKKAATHATTTAALASSPALLRESSVWVSDQWVEIHPQV